MSSIPEEIYVDIFLKVSVKSLLACKCVCKTWLSLISNPDFVKMQLNLAMRSNNPNLMLHGLGKSMITRYRNAFYSVDSLESLLSTDKLLEHEVELDYPFKSFGYSVELMACCDGLVCLWLEKRKFFCIWNPTTREYKVLPKSNISYVSMVAFGYDYKSNNYKLLVCAGWQSEVYVLGLESWERNDDAIYEFHDSKTSGVLVNGDLHWLAGILDHFNLLVSLDISNEIFKEIELPKETLENASSYFTNLGVLEGCLCLLENLNDYVKIWVMQKYGVGESWTNRYVVNNKRIINDADLSLLWSFMSGEILFRGNMDLVLYDPEYGSVRDIRSLRNLFQGEPYFESLVSLKSGTYVGEEEQVEEPN